MFATGSPSGALGRPLAAPAVEHLLAAAPTPFLARVAAHAAAPAVKDVLAAPAVSTVAKHLLAAFAAAAVGSLMLQLHWTLGAAPAAAADAGVGVGTAKDLLEAPALAALALLPLVWLLLSSLLHRILS